MEQQTEYRTGITPRAGLFILIALMGAGAVVGGMLSLLVWKWMTGQDALQMQLSMSNPVFVHEVRTVQTLVSVFMFLLPAWIAASLVSKKPFAFLGFAQRSSPRSYGLGLVLMLVTIVLSGALATLSEWIPITSSMKIYFKGLEQAYMRQVEVMSQMKNLGDFVVSLLVMAALPALVEELFFRAGFQNMMYRSTNHLWVSVILTALLFSAIHFSFYGFLSRTALGIVLGLLFAYSKNIWMPIIAHFLNYAIAVGQVYYLRSRGDSIASMMEDRYPLWWPPLALVVLFFGFRNYRRSLNPSHGTQQASF
jgi:membrane protease YdiL (CAAX protease family)